jgi:hypothetical protein
LFQIKVPTGKYQNVDASLLGADLTGKGSWDMGAGLTLSKRMRPWILHSDLIYSVPLQAQVDNVRTTYGTYLNYDFAGEYFFEPGFNLELELNGVFQSETTTEQGTVPDSSSHLLTLVPAIGWSTQQIQALLGYQVGVLGINAWATRALVLSVMATF